MLVCCETEAWLKSVWFCAKSANLMHLANPTLGASKLFQNHLLDVNLLLHLVLRATSVPDQSTTSKCITLVWILLTHT